MREIITPSTITFAKEANVRTCKIEKNSTMVCISELTLGKGWSKEASTKITAFGTEIFVFGRIDGGNPFNLGVNQNFFFPKCIVCNDNGAVKTFITLAIGYDGSNTYLFSLYNDAYFIIADSNLPIMPTYKIIST